MYHDYTQDVQTAVVSITPEKIAYGWQEIRRQEEMQRQLLEEEDPRHEVQQSQKKAEATSSTNNDQLPVPSPSILEKPLPSKTQKKEVAKKLVSQPSQQFVPNTSPEQIIAPTPDLDDDEPDRL